MLKKGKTLYSIITGACPKCHNESMYENKNAYKLSDTLKMHDHCSHCNTKYKIEPSFFYGAMYVSYAVGVAFSVAAFIVSYVFIGTTAKTAFIVIASMLILFMPIIMRLSRNIWINMFVNYDKNLEANKSN